MKLKYLSAIPVILIAGILVLSGCSVPQTGTHEPAAGIEQTNQNESPDVLQASSGRVQLTYHRVQSTTPASWNTVTAYVDPDEVLIGGFGGIIYPEGTSQSLLYHGYVTGSFPVSDYTGHTTGWRTQTKDHGHVFRHTAYSVAIGMKIKNSQGNFADRAALAANIMFVGNPSGYANHPSAIAKVPSGYKLIGGGAQVMFPFGEDGINTYGNMLTDTKPTDKLDGWYAASKDQLYASPARIMSWAICIKKKLQYLGSGFPSSLDVKFTDWTVVNDSNAYTYCYVHGTKGFSGYLIAGIGAFTRSPGYGRLITRLSISPGITYYYMSNAVCGQMDSATLGIKAICIK